jgi:hypothetical protein
VLPALDAGLATGGRERSAVEVVVVCMVATGAGGADRDAAVAACGDHRPSLPAFTVDGGEPIGPAQLRGAVLAAGARPGPLPGIEDALRRCGAMAAAEVAEVCDVPGPRARIELWAAAASFRVRPSPSPFGELWSLA